MMEAKTTKSNQQEQRLVLLYYILLHIYSGMKQITLSAAISPSRLAASSEVPGWQVLYV